MNCGALDVDQARGVEIPVRIVPLAPADGEPLAEPGAGHLPAELGPEAAASVAGAAGHRALEVAQLRPHVRLERARDDTCELHQRRPVG